MHHAHSEELEHFYVENRRRLVAFIQGRVRDEALAEDILQDSLLRALRSSPDLENSEDLVQWIYRIIRNAITDSYRRKGARERKLESFSASTDPVVMPPDVEAEICGCIMDLLPTLKPEYAEVLRAIDLGGHDSGEVAAQLGITPGNLKVRRFRARQHLRERLERTCRTCAEHGCLDCSCRRS